MNQELKLFLEELNKKSNNGFMFLKLYYQPKAILGDSENPTPEEYDKINNYFDLFLNNDFIKFVDLSLDDETFVNRLDISLYKKLSFFLYDSIDFKKGYSERAIQVGNNEIKIDKNMSISEISQLVCLYRIYKQYEKIYNYDYPKEQIFNYDVQYAKTVRQKLLFNAEILYERGQNRKNEKDLKLKIIENDDYNNQPFLERALISPTFGVDYDVFDSLVCENRFIEVVKKLISQNKLKGFVLDNVIEILSFSIGVKNFSINNCIEWQNRLGKNIVNQYNINEAQKMLSELVKLKQQEKLNRLRVLK